MEIEKYLKIQEEMRKDLLIENRIDKIERIGGVDQAFPNRKNIISCIVVLDEYEMSVIEKRFSIKEIDFPYIPGLLSFRE
ncbi:MAG: endonuclease V, partial [Candidatus Altiarchaeales archaeon]